MNNKTQKLLCLLGTGIGMLLLVALFVFQATHLIISIWNIVPVAIMIMIFVSCIKKRKSFDSEPDDDTKLYKTEKIQHKLSIKSKIIGILICVCTLVLSILFFNIYENKKKNLNLVTSTVVSQKGEITYETYEDEDGTTTQESRYCEIIVSYEFNSTTKTAKIKTTNTNKVYVDTLKIYVDSKGDFVCDYGAIFVWEVEAIIFLSFTIFAILFLILNYPLTFWAMIGFIFGGFALLMLFGKSCFENLLYNEILIFMSLFIFIGLFGIAGLTYERFFVTTKKVVVNQNSPHEKNSKNDIEYRKNKLNRCSYCGYVNLPSATKCEKCGAPKIKR